jgi:hypothetical protein
LAIPHASTRLHRQYVQGERAKVFLQQWSKPPGLMSPAADA